MADPNPRDVDRLLTVLSQLVEESGEAMFEVDRDGAVASWNRGAERITGLPAIDVVGTPAVDLSPERFRAEGAAILGHVLAGERLAQRPGHLLAADGTIVPVWMTMVPVEGPDGSIDGAAVVLRDVSEQVAAQESLAAAEARLRQVQGLAHIGLWVWDRATATVQWSEELHRICGVDPLEFGGDLDAHLAAVDVEHRSRVQRGMERAVATGTPYEDEYPVIRPNGERRWLSTTAELTREADGHMAGLRGISQDLTLRHEAETALRNALEAERRAGERLREADALKDEFLGTVSHELRTPLAAIMGFGRVLTEPGGLDDPERTHDFIRRMERHATEMHDMVERLLDFSRLAAERIALRPEPLTFGPEVDKIVEQIAVHVAGRHVEVVAGTQLVVHTDPMAFGRVMVNLLVNAAKFSEEGARIEVGARRDGDSVVCWVTDEGQGIPSAALPRVFDRFYQVAEAQPSGRRGSGVGLSIVRRYVELLGGEVSVRSVEGQGATFSFTLPVPGDGDER